MYGKLFASMFDGSLAQRGPWEALVTFMPMLALADLEGFVDMTPEAISRRTLIPLEIIRKGITALEQPDPESRDPAEEGRRIIRLSDHRSWGWKIVNYEKYRKIRSAEERREYMREFMRNKRAGVTVTAGPEHKDTLAEKPGTRGARLSVAGGLNPEWKAWCSKDTPTLDPDAIWASFADYWVAQPGRKGVKLDWFATWRNWCRTEAARGAPKAASGGFRPAAAPDGKIVCRACGSRVLQHTDGYCDPCWRKR